MQFLDLHSKAYVAPREPSNFSGLVLSIRQAAEDVRRMRVRRNDDGAIFDQDSSVMLNFWNRSQFSWKDT